MNIYLLIISNVNYECYTKRFQKVFLNTFHSLDNLDLNPNYG